MEAPSSTRCITVLGHVDHGKTTFVDSLLAANNIISARMAGKIRYLDSREDEQERGITMESSAISLRFKMMKQTPSGQAASSYVINLIDTPGHVDFLSEVSTASRLCDGALVMVDVVEGVCTQTITVLRQAWQDRLRPILIVNKIDRLITELKLSPTEAHQYLVQLLENVNAVMGSFYASERMEDDLRWREERERRLAKKKELEASQIEADAEAGADAGTAVEEDEAFAERDDEDIYFAPEKGNVIFASAIDGWAFRVGKFAQLYAKKLGVNESNLRRALWGEFYLDPKTKRVVSHRQLKGRNLKPLFVQFVLENIWAVYENVVVNPNPDKVSKIVTALDLKIQPRDLRAKDTRHTVQLIFSQWLSLSTCTFQTVVEIVPPPEIAQRERMRKMLYPELQENTVVARNKVEEDLFACRSGDLVDGKPGTGARAIGFVSKMFAVPRDRLPVKKEEKEEKEPMTDLLEESTSKLSLGESEPEPAKSDDGDEEDNDTETEQTDEVLLGFARLFSGTLATSPTSTKSNSKPKTKIYALLPKYNPALPRTHPRNAPYILGPLRIKALYEMMGRDLVRVESVRAGNVFAVEGLEGFVGRSGTLVEVGGEEGEDGGGGAFVNLASVHNAVSPIVRVALEPKEPSNMPQLVRGLKLLAQSDPCAEAFQQKTGEWVILTAGELHLERCLKDLRERFAKVEIQASQPIVPYRETAVKVPDMLPTKSPLGIRGAFKGSSQGIVTFTIRARPLPDEITTFLQRNASIIKKLHRDTTTTPSSSSSSSAAAAEVQELEDLPDAEAQSDELVQRPSVASVDEFWKVLDKLLVDAGSDFGTGAGIVDRIWAFGPNRVGPNLLFTPNGSWGGMDGFSLRERTSSNSKKTNGPGAGAGTESQKAAPKSSSEPTGLTPEFGTSIETGFQIAMFQGPLCAEPVEGMAYFVESVEVDRAQLEGENANAKLAQIGGSLISASKEACRAGLLDWSPRLKMAIYSCDIQASTDVLGKVYGVVARRRGKIISEEMKEGTSFFSIHATLPVVESFGFADDIRKRSSGAASPQLIFSGYEILPQDPFWVPTTEEELEDLGDKADRANIAKVYMDKVRKRKGMFVETKVVENAEKQRTLKR